MGLKAFIKRATRVTRAEESAPPTEVVSAPAPYDLALAFHRAGRLEEAAKGYGALVAEQPSHAQAHHMLGLVRFQQGDSAAAIEHLKQAVAHAPDDPVALGNLGEILRSCSRFAEAEVAFRRAVELSPGFAMAHKGLGFVRLAHGNARGAVGAFRRAVECDADDFNSRIHLGLALLASGDAAEAKAVLDRVIGERPEVAEAHYSLGKVLASLGRRDAAEACFNEAIKLNPELVAANLELGVLLHSRGERDAAEAAYRRVLKVDALHVAAIANLADVMRSTDRLEEAEQLCYRALALNADFVEAHNTLGLVRKARGDVAGAEAEFRKALSINPSKAPAHVNLGLLYRERGEDDVADRAFRSALEHEPENATARYNLGTAALMRGDYVEGFSLYESRFDCFRMERRASAGAHWLLGSERRWGNSGVAGKRVLVWTEQGLGDAVMMMRFLPALHSLGTRQIIVLCAPPLARCMKAMRGVDRVLVSATPPPEADYDVHVPIMSLPHRLGVTRERLSEEMPYLGVPDSLRTSWAERLGERRALRVGLAWAGNKELRDDDRRSIPFETLRAILGTSNVELFSLQKEHAITAAKLDEHGIRDFMPECGDLMDTAALIAQLDLVISVDSVVAHLAGAIGARTWMLNRAESEWRWGREGTHSVWYPSVRIVRQRTAQDWSTTIDGVANALASVVQTGRFES